MLAARVLQDQALKAAGMEEVPQEPEARVLIRWAQVAALPIYESEELHSMTGFWLLVAVAAEVTGQVALAAQEEEPQELMELPVRAVVEAVAPKLPAVQAGLRMDALATASQVYWEQAELAVHVPIPAAAAAAVIMAVAVAAATITPAVMTAAAAAVDQVTPIRHLQPERFIPGVITPGMARSLFPGLGSAVPRQQEHQLP
jgi:hypothetical protein